MRGAPALVAALTIVVLWSGLASTTLFGQEMEDWTVERSRQEVQLDEGRRVIVNGSSGDVRIRPGEAGVVELSWVAQRHADDAFVPSVELREVQGGLFVDPTFLDEEGSPVAELPVEPRRRIDLVVYVPATTEVEIRGDRDTAEIKGLEAPIVVTTIQGDIAIFTTSSVTAVTERGEIQVTLSRLRWEGSSCLESLTGNITVRLPPEPDIEVRGETFGELTTDFSVEIERRPPSVKKHFTATIGRSGRVLEVTSNRGGIKLLRSPS